MAFAFPSVIQAFPWKRFGYVQSNVAAEEGQKKNSDIFWRRTGGEGPTFMEI